MQLRTHPAEEPHIDLTSLIDVVFLLLLFFMVSTTFESTAALRVDVPEASTAQPAPRQPDRLELVIDADGRMFLNDRQLVDSSSAALAAALAEAAGDRRDQTLILRADRETPHHFVVTAMDVAAQSGFTNLSIAADRTAGPAE
jgi:biopolymer transport protein ExbD